MVIKVYISRISGSQEIKKKQEFVLNLLSGKKIELEEIDITDPTLEAQKQFMREHATPKEGQNVPLPPQIFNEDDYCGDFEGLHESNENDELFEFLKLAPPKNVSTNEVTLSDQTANGHEEQEQALDQEHEQE